MKNERFEKVTASYDFESIIILRQLSMEFRCLDALLEIEVRKYLESKTNE